MFVSKACIVWDNLKKRFDRVDILRTYNLHKEIIALQQGTTYVSTYYTNLWNLWDEFEALIPLPIYDYEKSRGFVSDMNTISFL